MPRAQQIYCRKGKHTVPATEIVIPLVPGQGICRKCSGR